MKMQVSIPSMGTYIFSVTISTIGCENVKWHQFHIQFNACLNAL